MNTTPRRRPARRHALLLCACALLAACQDTPTETAGSGTAGVSASDPLVQRLASMGFQLSTVRDLGDRFLIDGDVEILKSQLALAGPSFSKLTPGGPSYQYHTNVVINQNVMAQGLRISLVPISGNAAWTNAARRAIQEWNWSGGNKIYFTEVTSSPDIEVMFDPTIGSGSYAVARYPINGYPGNYVRINSTKNPTNAVKLSIMMHELGHVIGFRHSDWPTSDPANEGANLIPGTPVKDLSSVMYSGFRGNRFSGYDQIASSYVYPSPAAGITSQGYDASGNFVMSWAAVPSAAQYRISYEYWYEEFVYDPTYPGSGYYAWSFNSYAITTTTSTTFSDAGQGTGAAPYACSYQITPIYPSGKDGPTTRSQDVTC